MLGSSESAEDAHSLFRPLDKKHRIYARRAGQRIGLSLPTGSAGLTVNQQPRPQPGLHSPALLPVVAKNPADAPVRTTWSSVHENFIKAVAPPSVMVSSDYDIVHLSESAGRFLRVPGGEGSRNLLRLAHPQLRTELRAALFRATRTQGDVSIPSVPVALDGERRWVDISVQHSEEAAPDFLLVTFIVKDFAVAKTDRDGAPEPPSNSEVLRRLEEEIEHLRSGSRETAEQYEASTEELKASNEELQAMNEELRSATEEMETGREELQPINEEITTINQELKSKVEQLDRSNSDLQNLMASTKIATIFLNRKLEIQRFTPSSTGLFNLIASDIGRPLSDLTHRLDYPAISDDAELVLEHLTPVEREVQDLDGHWFLVRLLPYRTTEDQIAGVVINCVDITARKQSEEARGWLADIVKFADDAIFSISMDGRIVSWNRGAERIFGYQAAEIVGQLQDLLVPADRQREMDAWMEQVREGHGIGKFDTVRLRNHGEAIDVSLSISVMVDEFGHLKGATGIARDITDRKRAIEELRQAHDELETRVQERTAELDERVKQLAQMASELTTTEQRERERLASVLHDQLQQVLVSARMRIETLKEACAELQEAEADRLLMLIDEALSNSRSLAIELSPPALKEGLGKALEWLCASWAREKYNMELSCSLDTDVDARDDKLRLLIFQAVKELLLNVVKHAGVHAAEVELAAAGDNDLQVIVRDHGSGFDSADLEHGNGSGLLNLSERLQLMGGSFEITTESDVGTQAIIRAPRRK